MTEEMIIEVGRQTIEIALLVSLPLLAVSLVIGLLISLVQVATSIQDVTLSFVPKIVAVGITLIIAGAWMLQMLVTYTSELFRRVPEFIG